MEAQVLELEAFGFYMELARLTALGDDVWRHAKEGRITADEAANALATILNASNAMQEGPDAGR